jgi:hypothetical protein
MICPTGKAEYFSKWDWTRQIRLIRLNKFLFSRKAERPGVGWVERSDTHHVMDEAPLTCPSGTSAKPSWADFARYLLSRNGLIECRYRKTPSPLVRLVPIGRARYPEGRAMRRSTYDQADGGKRDHALSLGVSGWGGVNPEFRMNAGGLHARAVEVGGQMIILAGSQARIEEAPSLASNVRTYREQLRRAGKLSPPDGTGTLRFVEDVSFTSPSAAAMAVMGTSRNGRTDWINTSTNETYADWQERLVTKSEAQPGESPNQWTKLWSGFGENGRQRYC